MHSLTLKSVSGRDATTIELQTGPTYTGALEIGGVGNDVTVDGFTIQGRDAACPTLATSNMLVDGGRTRRAHEQPIRVGESTAPAAPMTTASDPATY